MTRSGVRSTRSERPTTGFWWGGTYERHWTPVHLDFDVDDVDAAVAEVKRLGGTVEDLERGEWGAAALCADPFGNGFCLLAIRS